MVDGVGQSSADAAGRAGRRLDSQVPQAMMPVLTTIVGVMASPSHKAPHSMPKTGMRKVTVRARLGPMRWMSLKNTT